MKPGSNWISWPVNLMLTDFTLNWVLFLFLLFHTKEGSKSKKSGRVCVISMTQRCLVTLPLASAGSCFCPVSLFLLLSQFSAYNTNVPEPILTILGHTNPLQYRYMSHDQHGVTGHVGVTGVKRSFFTENASPTNFEQRSCDLYIWSIYSSCILVVLF